jgi:hypothetical protein
MLLVQIPKCHWLMTPAMVAIVVSMLIPCEVFAQADFSQQVPPAGSQQPGYEQPQYAQPPQNTYTPPPAQNAYAPPGGAFAPPVNYGSPPQYGGPPQQQYGGQQQYGAPPQYGAPQYGGPPPQYGGQQQYGGPPPQYGAPQYGGPPPQYGGQMPYQQQGGVTYAPAGTSISVALRTSISTQIAKEGDFIEAAVSQPVALGGSGSIPAGSVVAGQITSAEAGRRLSRSGALSIDFNQLRLPNGVTIPIQAHLSSGAGKYKQKGDGQFRGEGGMAKLGQTAIRGGLGAGLGAALGTGVGAIAGGGHGAGMGAWSGAAIGGGVGVADMLLRKGRDVTIPSGTEMEIQLDQPVSIPDANGTVQQPASGGVF